MSKQKLTAEEKHYIKLNNQLRKQINQLKCTNIQLLDKNNILQVENDSFALYCGTTKRLDRAFV